MRTIYIWLTALGLVPWVLRKAAQGELTEEQAAWILVGATVLAALPRAMIRVIMRVVPVCIGFVFIAREYSHGDPNTFWAIFNQLMGLAITLLGLAILVSAPFQGMGRRR